MACTSLLSDGALGSCKEAHASGMHCNSLCHVPPQSARQMGFVCAVWGCFANTPVVTACFGTSTVTSPATLQAHLVRPGSASQRGEQRQRCHPCQLIVDGWGLQTRVPPRHDRWQTTPRRLHCPCCLLLPLPRRMLRQACAPHRRPAARRGRLPNLAPPELAMSGLLAHAHAQHGRNRRYHYLGASWMELLAARRHLVQQRQGATALEPPAQRSPAALLVARPGAGLRAALALDSLAWLALAAQVALALRLWQACWRGRRPTARASTAPRARLSRSGARPAAGAGAGGQAPAPGCQGPAPSPAQSAPHVLKCEQMAEVRLSRALVQAQGIQQPGERRKEASDRAAVLFDTRLRSRRPCGPQRLASQSFHQRIVPDARCAY
jgi:hypothetical protein